ncbi:hypothetical protein AGMMS50296_3490 [Alphaproteobacteria bacterium]|nr:hypothetical protein AGMMS50296_3490 [Alphaproteobacteria bacterium]
MREECNKLAPFFKNEEAEQADSFVFFQIAPTFQLDENLLRKRYFEKCLQFRDCPSKLAETHEHYRCLKDASTRLDLLNLSVQKGKNEEVAHEGAFGLPEEIQQLHTELLDVTPENCADFIAKIEGLKVSLAEKIQAAYENQQNWAPFLSQWRYYEKFLATAAQKKLKEGT